jgi:hypothetical protein
MSQRLESALDRESLERFLDEQKRHLLGALSHCGIRRLLGKAISAIDELEDYLDCTAEFELRECGRELDEQRRRRQRAKEEEARAERGSALKTT